MRTHEYHVRGGLGHTANSRVQCQISRQKRQRTLIRSSRQQVCLVALLVWELTLVQESTTAVRGHPIPDFLKDIIPRKRRRKFTPEIPWITDRTMSLTLHPTAALMVEAERRTLMGLNDTKDTNDQDHSVHDKRWFAPEQNAVYATIPDPADPVHRHNRDLLEFHAHRHLSRYEHAYRVHHHMDLHLDWNWRYDTAYHQWANEVVTESVTEDVVRSASNWTRRTNSRHNHRSMEARNTLMSQSEGALSPNSTKHIRLSGGQFDNYQAVPLSQGYGTHFANVWVGTPVPQRKTVIVDTGSHYTAFPCSGCKNCGSRHHTDPYYKPEQSKTFHQLQCSECEDRVVCDDGQCKFNQAYTEGSSWDAVQVKDQFYCGGTDVLDSVSPFDRKYAIEFMFGCQISMTGLFITQLADGIMGMSAHPATLPKKLFDHKKIEHNMFAMCYRRELGTSKRGVTAGSMTLGGVSSNLDTSPFVFAKNVAKVGWYTVYVKNIYVRTGGGQSAKSVDPSHETIKVRVNVKTLNSGKGVIVDSGTTDTYLNKKVAKDFTHAWKKATGLVYSHSPVSLTLEQLRKLPTILIQCQAYSPETDPTFEEYDTLPGYAGSLDPSSPNDLLIAIPATSYMDYSPITKQYMSRLYFTESVGGVLGSNTMQGHNVLFDWQNGRVGFAESSCAYDKMDAPTIGEESGFATDCELGEPVLTKPCIEDVDRRLCNLNSTAIALLGHETWTTIVDSPGNDAGVSCLESLTVTGKRPNDVEKSIVTCNGDGICEEKRYCQLTCAQAAKAAVVQPLDPSLSGFGKLCGYPRWSACDYDCLQTKLDSIAFSDGICHEIGRVKRPCHIGACARSDPCRVPFIVHVILAFRHGSISTWSHIAEEMLAVALENVVGSRSEHPIFTAGDVHVVGALPWYQDTDSETFGAHNASSDVYSEDFNSVQLGIKIVVEISIFNPSSAGGATENSTEQVEDVDSERDSVMSTILQNLTDRLRGRKAKTKCASIDLYSLAKVALKAKEALRNDGIMISLVDELRSLEGQSGRAAFGPINSASYDVSKSSILSVWLIRTGIDEEINYFGPQKPMTVKVIVFVQNMVFLSFVFFAVMILWGCSLSMYDAMTGQHHQIKRRNQYIVSLFSGQQPYTLVTRSEEAIHPDDVEDSLLRGTRGTVELIHRRPAYKLTMPKKRFRHTGMINGTAH